MAYQEIWPGWETIRLIGSGGFGKVYEIRKVDQTGDYRSALKVISVPQTPDEYRSYLDEGYDDESIVRIFRDQINQLVSEFQLMAEFKGTSNIVSYEDHMIIPHEDGHGWDVLIRMELLTSLPHIYQQKGMTEDEAIQVGMDICQALGIAVEIRPFTMAELMASDEVVTSSSGEFCLRVTEVDGKRVGGRAEGLLRRIQDALQADFLAATEG